MPLVIYGLGGGLHAPMRTYFGGMIVIIRNQAGAEKTRNHFKVSIKLVPTLQLVLSF